MNPLVVFGLGVIAYALFLKKERTIYVPQRPPENNTDTQANYMAWVTYATVIASQATRLLGSIDKAYELLWGPGGPFYNTPVPEYDAGSQFWQDVDQGQYA